MKALPTQQRALKKRMSLLNAALAEFVDVGFEVATAKSIASRAEVATGTFYQYFENKNDILRVIAENRFSDLHHQVALLENDYALTVSKNGNNRVQPIKDLFTRVLNFLYGYHLQEVKLHRVLEQRRGSDTKLEQIMCRGEDLMRGLVLHFIETSNVDTKSMGSPDLVADALYAMGEGLVHHLVFSKPEVDPSKMLETGARMLASYFENQ